MASSWFADRAVRRVMELLKPEAKAELGRLRIRAGNRVYRIPVGGGDEFVVLKLLPDWGLELRRLRKMLLRNFVYAEHCVEYLGKRRAEAEIARYREWHAEGLPVPALIEAPWPHVRIIQGLPYPSFRAVIEDRTVPLARKLRMVGEGFAALSEQHRIALARHNPGLVHPEPNPKNMLFDEETQTTYWLDLEHPGEYAKMTVDSLAVRGLRFYLLGVLDRLPDQVDPVLDLAVERYEPKRLLLSLADNFDQSLRRLPSRLAQRLVQGKAEVELRLRLISGVRHRLGRQELD